MARTAKQNKKSKNLSCTIDPDLFQAWTNFRRIGDSMEIKKASKKGFSRPTIDNALNYGYVLQPGLSEEITDFFTERLNREKERGNDIINASNADKDNG